MILGGALTTRKLTFDLGFANAAYNLHTMFSTRTGFFLVPPFNQRVDIVTDGPQVIFFRHDGAELEYEDISYILSKTLLFKAIEREKATEIRELAQEILRAGSTLLFPDPRRTQLECSVFENWARLTFYSQSFQEMAERILPDLRQFLPQELSISAHSGHDLTLRTKQGERLFLSQELLQKIAAVLVSYGQLLPELYQRFCLNVYQFGLMQTIRIFLHETLHAIKDAQAIGEHNIAGNLQTEQALRILKTLAQHGDLGLLTEADLAFLNHMRLWRAPEFLVFEGVFGLREFMQGFVHAAGPEIVQWMNAQLHENTAEHMRQMQRDGADIIEGTTAKPIDKDEAFRKLHGFEQKKLEE